MRDILANSIVEGSSVNDGSHRSTFRSIGSLLWLESTFFFLPLYNKALFDIFPYPLSATIIQVLVVFFVLAVFYCIKAKYFPDDDDSTWMFKLSDLKDKLSTLLAPGAAFAAVLAFTNVGLDLTSVALHVLLRSSELVWVIIFSWLFSKDKPSKVALLCVIPVLAGTAMVSYSAKKSGSIRVAALVVNLLSALSSCVLIVSTRIACKKLRWKVSGKVPVLEITAWKSVIAGIVLIPVAIPVEMTGVMHLAPKNTPLPFELLHSFPCLVGFLMLGAAITLSFQGAVVASLDSNTPTSMAVASQFKTLVGLVAAVAVAGSTMQICDCDSNLLVCPRFKQTSELLASGTMRVLTYTGSALIVVGSIAYGFFKRVEKREERARTSLEGQL